MDRAANKSYHSLKLMFPLNDLFLLFHYSSSCFHALTVVFHAHSSRMMALSFKCISEGQPLHQTLKSEHTNKKVRKVHSVSLWRALKALCQFLFTILFSLILCCIHKFHLWMQHKFIVQILVCSWAFKS